MLEKLSNSDLQNFLYIFSCVVAFAIILRSLFKRFYYNRHSRNVRKANKILGQLGKFRNEEYGNAKVFSYLRKIDPFVFEELILTAVKNCGAEITRNKRYTGDGGIDGRCKINDIFYLIQSKRYSKYINRAHVEEFNNICRSRNIQGLFVHTGKTGKYSKDEYFSNVTIISGQKLIDLIFQLKSINAII